MKVRVVNQAGFSFVELLIAVSILAFSLATLIAFFINVVALNEASRNITTALSHAQYVLEDIRNAAFINIPTQIDSPNSTWDWNTAAVNAHGLAAIKDESINTLCVNSGGDEIPCASASLPLTIKVIVSWTESAGRTRSVAVATKMEGA
jgi:prepilin-type N-terminal cleavage/methylation domain-containing protein